MYTIFPKWMTNQYYSCEFDPYLVPNSYEHAPDWFVIMRAREDVDKMKHFKTWVKEGKALYAYGHTFTDSHMYFHEFMVQILLFFFFHYLNIFNLYENHCIKIKANLKWMNKISFRISKRNVMKWWHLEFLKTDFCLSDIKFRSL